MSNNDTYDTSMDPNSWYSGVVGEGSMIGQPQISDPFLYEMGSSPETITNITPSWLEGSTTPVFNVDEGQAEPSTGSPGSANIGTSLLNYLKGLLGGTTGGTTGGTGTSTLGNNVLGSILAALGASQASTPTTYTGVNTGTTQQTTQKPLTAESANMGSILQGLLPVLAGQMNLNPTQQALYNQTTQGQGIQSYLNPVSQEYTDAMKGLVLPGQQAIEASTSQALNRMAPSALSLGPQVENIIKQVSAANTGERDFANQIYKYLSDQATAANTGYGARAGTAMQLAGAPESQQATAMNSIQALINQLTTLYQGGAPQTQTGTTAQNTTGTSQTQAPSFSSSVLTGLGSGMLNNQDTLGSILKLLGIA